MSENEQRAVFSKNLNRYLSISEKSQKEVADAIGVSPQNFNTWVKGIALPRMSKVQLLADYFGIQKSDLLEEKSDGYYLNEETAQIAQQIYEDKELRALFDAARDADPEALQAAQAMLKVLKRKERGS